MENSKTAPLLFALLFLMAIPMVVHSIFTGSYIIDPKNNPRTFWVGPISTTIPYGVLATLFLYRTSLLKWKPFLPTYIIAISAWLSMMAFTIFLINQTPGPKRSSTMAIAVALTPFYYIPFFALGWTIGGYSYRLYLYLKKPNRTEADWSDEASQKPD